MNTPRTLDYNVISGEQRRFERIRGGFGGLVGPGLSGEGIGVPPGFVSNADEHVNAEAVG